MEALNDHPIDNVRWLSINSLDPNDYNPNFVLTPELKLLEFSLLKQGWIQPILVAPTASEKKFTIIDGFHRYTLAKTSKKVYAMTAGKVPCAILRLSEAERMLLTVRINRAKGNHIALKMHELVNSLHHDHGLTLEQIGKEIGAAKHEVETLMMDNIFVKKDVANTDYGKAWYPRGSTLAKGREWRR